MERFKIKCELSHQPVELRYDIKKIPGEAGPRYMVSVDGLFRGYIKREKIGSFGQLMSSDFTEDDMLVISNELRRLIS